MNTWKYWIRCGAWLFAFSLTVVGQSQILPGPRINNRKAIVPFDGRSAYQLSGELSPAWYFSGEDAISLEPDAVVVSDNGAFHDQLPPLNGNVADQDEIWLLDGRNAHCNPHDLSLVRTSRLVEKQWCSASISDLVEAHTSDPTKTTLLFVHGYRTDECYSVQGGFTFYNDVLRNCAQQSRGVRLVIWAWRSEKEMPRLCRDYAIVAKRSSSVGRSLGQVLAQFPDRQLVLVGYSLGCQSFLTALEEPALQLINDSTFDTGYQIALIAPALEGQYVSAQRWRQPFNHLVSKADIFDNTADRVLAGSRLHGRAVAPGGNLSVQVLAINGNLPIRNISIFDVAPSVGRQHTLPSYTADPTIQTRIQQMVVEQASGFRLRELETSSENP